MTSLLRWSRAEYNARKKTSFLDLFFLYENCKGSIFPGRLAPMWAITNLWSTLLWLILKLLGSCLIFCSGTGIAGIYLKEMGIVNCWTESRRYWRPWHVDWQMIFEPVYPGESRSHLCQQEAVERASGRWARGHRSRQNFVYPFKMVMKDVVIHKKCVIVRHCSGFQLIANDGIHALPQSSDICLIELSFQLVLKSLISLQRSYLAFLNSAMSSFLKGLALDLNWISLFIQGGWFR